MSIPLPGQPAPAPGAGDGSGEAVWAARADSGFVTVVRPVRRPASAPSSAAPATATAALVAVALGLFFIVMMLSYELNMNIPVDEYSIDLPWTVVTPGLLTAWLAGTLTGAGVVWRYRGTWRALIGIAVTVIVCLAVCGLVLLALVMVR